MPARRWLATAVLTAALAAALVACRDDKPAARPLDTTAAPGFTVVSDGPAGFAISLPTGWRQLPLDVGSFDGAADQLRKESDKVGPALTQLKSVVRSGANLAAADPSTGSTVNLIVLPADSEPDEIATQTAIQLRGTGATGLTKEKVTVDGVSAVRQRFRLPFPADPGSVELQESQYYVVRRGKAYILTLVGDSPQLEQIAASLQLA